MKEKSQTTIAFFSFTLCSLFMCVIISSSGFGAGNNIKAEFGTQPQLDGQKVGKIYKTESYPADGLAILKAGGATDKGDFYRADKRKIRLFRSLHKLVILTKEKQSLDLSAVNVLLDSESTVELEKNEPLKSVNVLKTKKRMTPAKLDNILRNLRQSKQFERVNPVFINEETGKEMMITSRIIVKLAEGTSAKQIEPIHKIHSAQVVGHMRGAPEEIILDLGEANAEEILNICEAYQQDPLVEWASPDFLFELDLFYSPDDPLYLNGNQWHLNNTGQSGGNSDADVDAPEAWDTSTGSSNIAIAIIDTGVDDTHPDLDDNIYTNEAEASGTSGVDDDGNGYIDDINGWDFYSNDNNPNPGSTGHPHGTCCAGVAAAEGDNATGVAGIAYNCEILPVKLSSDTGTFASSIVIGNAIRYAADMAHVLSNSWGGGSADSTIHAAIQYAVDTKGKPVFFSTGNNASGWIKFTLSGFPSGTFTFTWKYTKDASIDGGDDTVWLDDVTFPGGASEGFEGTTFPPSGWISGGNANWTQYEESTILENRLHVRWTGTKSAKAGNINRNQTTYLQTTRAVGAGDLTFYAWVSSEAGYDKFEFALNGYTYFTYSGVPAINYDVGYPARYSECIAVGASTDHDYRSQYSQYDETLDHVLDIVAPSSGGNWGIATTDIIGSGGYDTGDYTNPSGSTGFGGTSSACPLAAGVAALLLSLNPDLNPGEIIQIMKNTADKIGSVAYTDGYNKYYGYGRVNAQAALAALSVISITVNPGTWNIEETNLGEIEETELNYFTAENNGNVAEDFAIVCGNSVSGDWFCVEAITDSEQFTMNAQGGLLTNWTSIHASVPLAENVAAPVGDDPGGSVQFGLQFTAPTATEHMDSPQEIFVTITASEHL
ncbi:MAG: S8 family serine peptidase [bacterium]